MSGRSAYVRKQVQKSEGKNKNKERESRQSNEDGRRYPDPLLESFPMPVGRHNDYHNYNYESSRKDAKSVLSTSSEDKAYARVRKPVLPVLDVSGIEKSSFREMMDKKSEGIRKGLLGFGKKKKKVEEPRPQTSTTIRPTHHDDESVDTARPPSRQLLRQHQKEEGVDVGRPGPPHGKLPPVPPPPQLKRWTGAGRPPHPWNKLRKDPELWDAHGDTLIFLAHESHKAARAPPSFRVSSHVLEATESKYLIRMLREGYVDFYSDSELPPSPISSVGGFSSASGYNRRKHLYRNDPITPLSESASQDPDGQISYELFFPAPINQSKAESLRYHATTRNVFALLYQASLVGLNLLQALVDLHERLLLYMPPDADSSELIIILLKLFCHLKELSLTEIRDYITTKRIDDARNDPAAAIALLTWSEGKTVRWQEGWREFFVHCVGMHNRLDTVAELRFVTPISKALIERASLEVEVRIQSVADRLTDFKFDDMWPAMLPQPPPERASFDRLRLFLKGYYEAFYGSWPPPSYRETENWLSREVVRDLQNDFGALYDYLVNREVVWDFSDKRHSGKWKIASTDPSKKIQVDTIDLPMNDILVAYDNRHRYPHIPHPYPLVPDSMPVANSEPFYKSNKRVPPNEGKMTERKTALAYTEATNIYVLGPDFVSNKLADAFIRFEKNDKASEVDPFAARRGRWVLIYGILQALASVSVDSPGLRYKDDVPYHLIARLRGTPPWKGANQNAEEANHKGSYCWQTPKQWGDRSESDVPMLDSLTISPLVSPRNKFSKLALSIRSSTAPSVANSGISRGSDVVSAIGKSPRQRPSRLLSSARSSAAPSVATSVANSGTGTESDTGSPVRSPDGANGRPLRWVPRGARKDGDGLGIDGGYGPGIEKIDEWPIREESRQNSFTTAPALTIKDFDDYRF